MSAELLRTPLYDLHLELGAKMVPFAGYAMPVNYPAASSPSTANAANRRRCSMSRTWASCG
jgi:glycine cleavage system aminomethyltransferase T